MRNFTQAVTASELSGFDNAFLIPIFQIQIMTSWPYQRNHNLQNYVYGNGNSFSLDFFFFLHEHFMVGQTLTYSTGNSKTKERITLASLQSSEAIRLKMSHSEGMNKVASTDSTNQHC